MVCQHLETSATQSRVAIEVKYQRKIEGTAHPDSLFAFILSPIILITKEPVNDEQKVYNDIKKERKKERKKEKGVGSLNKQHTRTHTIPFSTFSLLEGTRI
jgi:hypothetical protein